MRGCDRVITGRCGGEHGAAGPPREQETWQAAGKGEHRALRQELPHELPASGADGEAQRQLAPAGDAACEEEVGDVRAHDEEEERDA